MRAFEETAEITRHARRAARMAMMGRTTAIRRTGATLVAAVLTVVLGTDPATAGPVTAQIVAVEVAVLDALDSRAQNRQAVPLDEPAQVAVTDRQVQVEQPPVYETPVPPAVVLPAGGIEVVEVPVASATEPTTASEPGDGTVGGLALSLEPVPGVESPTAVQVQVADQATAEAAELAGVVLELADASGQEPAQSQSFSQTESTDVAEAADAAQVRLSVDYAQFAGAYGGGWASRLQIVQVPDCALTTPGATGCVPVPVSSSVNDTDAQMVSAVVEVTGTPETATMGASSDAQLTAFSATAESGGGATYAVAASTSGPGGDWAASPLTPSASWSVSGATGSFSWSYPLQVPAPPAGPAPQLALSYSSASLDGRTPGSNTQSSWVGDGWDLATGFVERSYVPCARDGGNAPATVGDLCWGGENALLVFGGKANELVKDDQDDDPVREVWRPKNDDGTRVERALGAGNGDDDGEYWVVTTADGVRYTFGRSAQGQRSAWTVPVYGNNAGEPGHAASFAGSETTQAWRWMLDHVEDRSGNTMTYSYTAEQNRYAAAGGSDGVKSYTRGGWLDRIDYGTRAGVTTAPYQVRFGVAERCMPTDGHSCDPPDGSLGGDGWRNAAWFDTPVDLLCDSTTSCPRTGSPVFFTTKRLTTVTTSVHTGGAYKEVDSWTLNQAWRDPGDLLGHVLWLDSITRTAVGGTTGAGQGGDDVVMPKVWFTGDITQGRVVSNADGVAGRPPMQRFRVTGVHTETGGTTWVTYGRPNGCSAAQGPSGQTWHRDTNRLCFPVKWSEAGKDVVEYFHRYLVTRIIQSAGPDATNGPLVPNIVTSYEYDPAGPVWAQPTNPLIPAADRLWSDFRGYPSVTTRVGSGTEQTRQTSSYFLGVESRSLSADLDGAGPQAAITATDAEPLNGQAFQTSAYNGAVPVSSSVSASQISDPSARHTVAGQEVLARRIASTTSWSAVYGADGAADHVIRATTTFDEFAQVDTIDDAGDVTDSGDDLCTDVTYARNLDAWMTGAASRTLVYSASCATSPSLPADLVSDSREHFDDGGFGAAPTRGLATRTETVNPATGSGYVSVMTATYDALGRATSSTDALGRTSTTTYTPTGAGVPASATARSADPDGTGPLTAHETTIDLHPLLGVPVKSTDPNGRITTASYDSLGRRTAVWTPERQGKSAAATYEYTVSRTGVNSVQTRVLGADGVTYHASSQVYDALLRPVQSQAESADARHRVVQNGQVVETGRIITDTKYDSVGRVKETTGAWYAHGSPSGTWVQATTVPPSTTTYVYDGAGRATEQILWSGNTSNPDYEKWRTTTDYDGATTLMIPPQGGVPTATTIDARGRTTTLSQYLRDPRQSAAADTAAEVRLLGHQDTTYAYDHAGRLASVTDPEANTWTYGYDHAGRQISANDPDNGLTRTEYDLTGQVLATTDATGTTLAYQYDALGRRTTTRESGATGPVRATWVHDVLTDASGIPLTTAGSVVKGLTTASIRYATPGDTATAHATSVTGYDAGYRPLGSAVRVPAGTLGSGVPTTYETKYGYTAGGAADRVTLPQVKTGGGGTVLGAETVTTYYDAASVPSWMAGGFGWGTYVAASITSAFGQPLLADLGTTYGAVVSWTYDDVTGRLTNLALDRERINGTDLNLTYSYDHAGNVLSVKDQPTAAARAGQQWQDNQCFTYDALRRLTHAWTAYLADNCNLAPGDVEPGHVGGAAPYRHKYDYDPLGNRTALTEHATDGSATTTVTDYDPGEGLDSPDPATAAGPHAVVAATRTTAGQTLDATTYSFDDAGRTTGATATGSSRDLNWDAEGELASVTSTTGAEQDTARYVYTADRARLLRIDDSGTTLYLPGGQEITSQNGTVTATRHYSFGGQAVAVRTGAGLGGVTSLVCDHHGTTVAAVPNTSWTTTSVQRMYTTPFGGARGNSNDATVPGDRQFLDKTRDTATGYTLIGARYYDETLGRFLTVDPVMDLANPQQWNAYSYAGNNPLTWWDPTGLTYTGPMIEDGGVAWGSLAGAAAGTAARPSAPSKATGVAATSPPPVNIYRGDGRDIPAGGLQAGTLVEQSLLAALQSTPGYEPWIDDLVPIVGPCTDVTPMGNSCYNTEAEMQRFAELGYALFIEDYANCAEGDVGGCIWIAVGALPGGKIVKLADAVGDIAKVSDNVADAANAGCKGGDCGIPGGTCFVAGTAIRTEGGVKPIEEIEVGDRVWAKDLTTGKDVLRTVDKTYVRHVEELYELTITGAVLTTTAEHPFWVDGMGWTEARDLHVGQWLVTPDGVVTLDGVEVLARSETVYNFRVEIDHNYYALAGPTPVLVHNADYSFTPRTERAGDVGRYTQGQSTRDAFSHYEFMDSDEFLATINGVEEGAGINVSRGGTIMDGHHRWDELQRRITDGRIDPNTPIDIWVLGGE